jgi:hypothetical protein
MRLPTPYLSQQPVDDFGLRFSELKYSVSIPALTDVSLTIPGNASRYKIIFRAEGFTVWVALNQVAESPAGATFALTTSELISVFPLGREVKSGDIVHCYNGSATDPIDVSVILYAIGTNN